MTSRSLGAYSVNRLFASGAGSNAGALFLVPATMLGHPTAPGREPGA